MERTPVRTVAVPEPLDRCGPLRNSLDLVEDEDGAARPLGFGPRPLPSADNPAGVQRFVRDRGQANRCYHRCGCDGSSSRPSPEFRRGLIGGEIQTLGCDLPPESRASACRTMVVLPAWRGPESAMIRLGSSAEAAKEVGDLRTFEGEAWC